MHKIGDNLKKVCGRIERAALAANRAPHSVRLLAVSKTQPAEALRCAWGCGQRLFGENYLQEALEKQRLLADLALEWHFIGPIQSNKTRAIAENFDWVHSIDRFKIAQRLSEQRPAHKPPLDICLQINVDNEESKAGVSFADLPALAQAVASLPRLRLRGLMAIPAPRQNPADQQQAFTSVSGALDQLRTRLQQPTLDTLSMGMSADLEAAIGAGATIVRVGTDIFGPRPPQNQHQSNTRDTGPTT